MSVKDMGVCDGAYAVLERVFAQAGVTEFDYAQGYQLMLGMMDQLEVEATQSGEPGHDTAQGWLQWCYDLRGRPEAIMYFGDHIEEDLFRTADGQLHETLEAARDHDRRRFAELRQDHAAARVINGVRVGEGGAETWEVVAEGTLPPGTLGHENLLAETGKESNGITDNFRLFEEGLSKIVAALRSKGHPVLIFTGIPELSFDVNTSIARSAIFGLQTYKPLPYAIYEARNRRTTDAIEKIATDEGAIVVHSERVFCTDVCIVMAEGKPLIRDTTHPSIFGAQWFVPRALNTVELQKLVN